MSAVQQMLVGAGGGAACDPLWSSVLYLLDGEGNSLADKSSNAFSTTTSGSPTASTSSPLAGAYSPLFNGSTDYLTVGSSSNFDFGGSNHTVEIKFRLVSLSSVSVPIATRSNSGTQGGFEMAILTDGSGYWAWYTGVSGFTVVYYAAGTFTSGVDYDIAVVRSGTTWYAFLNGTSITSTAISLAMTAPFGPLRIGAAVVTGSPGNYFNGRVEARITTAARYTSSYTPPSTWPTSACAGSDPYYSNVVLLLHMDGSNGSTTFTDNSPSPKTMTANGNAQVNTSVVKYGTGSASFDGSGDWISTPNIAAARFNSGDFTIECWIYISSFASGTAQTVVNQRNVSGGNGWSLVVDQNGYLFFQATGGTPNYIISAAGAIALNTWYYVAVTRSGSVSRLFINGTQVDSSTTLTIGATTSEELRMGRASQGVFNYELTGYVDDLRLTNGVARYTANFTPPTGPFPNS